MFEYYSPTRIVFGNNSLDLLASEVLKLGKRPLVVCGTKFLENSGYLDKVIHLLKQSSIDVKIFNQVKPNPTAKCVKAIINMLKEHGCDCVVGIGGGSVLDAAKAAAVCGDENQVDQLIGTDLDASANRHVLPIIAIPSTAGTGSEVSKGSIIFSEKRGLKSGIRGNCVFPKVAIIDPKLTLSLPESVTLETAFDAITHATESYFAKKANLITEQQSLTALRLLLMNIEIVVDEPTNIQARENVAFAALLSGLNVANASTCFPHRIQQALGSIKEIEVSHPKGLACIYPEWMAQVRQFVTPKLEDLNSILGIEDYFETIGSFLQKYKLTDSLSSLGYRCEHIPIILNRISGNVTNDPMGSLAQTKIENIVVNSF